MAQLLDIEAEQAAKFEDTRRRAIAQIEADNDLKEVMSSRAGRRFVWRQLHVAGMWRPSFRGERDATDFSEGMRNVGLLLWIDIQRVCYELLLLMMKENQPNG